MPSIETKIWMALKRRIESLPMGYAVAWPAQIFEPNHMRPYLRVANIVTTPQRLFIGDDRPHERTGTLMVTLVHPLLKNPIEVFNEIQGKIAEHFKDGTSMQYQGICVTVAQYPHCIEGYLDNGWWNAPVSIPWRVFA